MEITHGDHTHTISLEDDGTLDTILKLDGGTHAVNSEYVKREEDGSISTDELKRLAIHACDWGF